MNLRGCRGFCTLQLKRQVVVQGMYFLEYLLLRPKQKTGSCPIFISQWDHYDVYVTQKMLGKGHLAW